MGNTQFTRQKMTFTIIIKQTINMNNLVSGSLTEVIFITKITHCVAVHRKMTHKSYVIRNVFSLYNNNNNNLLILQTYRTTYLIFQYMLLFIIAICTCPPDTPLYSLHVLVL